MMHLHALRIGQRIPQFEQCDVRVLHDQFFKEGPVRCQLAGALRATLPKTKPRRI